MSRAGRISPTPISPGAYITPAPEAGADADGSQAPALQVPANRIPRSDRNQRASLLRNSPADAINECRRTIDIINARIDAFISNPNLPATQQDGQSLTPLINCYREVQGAYESALTTLRGVSGILSKGTRQSAHRNVLKEFLSKREEARLSCALYMSLQHTMAADALGEALDHMHKSEKEKVPANAEEEQRQQDLYTRTFEHYGKAINTLSRFKANDLTIPQNLPYQEITDARTLFEHAIFNEMRYREMAFSQCHLKFLLNEHQFNQNVGRLSKIRAIRDGIENDAALEQAARNNKLEANASELREVSSTVVAQLPDLIEEAKALLSHNENLQQKLLVEKEFFPDSPDNQESLFAATIEGVKIHEKINYFYSLNMHEFLHCRELDGDLDKYQFEHMNRIHDNVMLLCRFFKEMNIEFNKEDGDTRFRCLPKSLDLLASTFENASLQLRYHSHVVRSETSGNPQYLQAASTISSLAESYLALSHEARRAQSDLIQHELAPASSEASKMVKKWTPILKDGINWELPPWLSEEVIAASSDSKNTVEAAQSGSATASRKKKKKAKPAESAKPKAGMDPEKAVEKLDERSRHFSELGKSALQDAQSRLQQMKDRKLTDQHTWGTIKFLMNIACENKQKELNCVSTALARLRSMQLPPQASIISRFEVKESALSNEVERLKLDAMRSTLEAIMQRPTSQGIDYLYDNKKLVSVAQPTWVELKDRDDVFRAKEHQPPPDYVIEYVMQFRADEASKIEKCVLHAHYTTSAPSDDVPPTKSHYKRFDERFLGKASEHLLPDGSVSNPVYRSGNASNGISIARKILPPGKWKPIPQELQKNAYVSRT